MRDSSPSSIMEDDSDTEFEKHTAAQRAEDRQSREDVDEARKPDSPREMATDGNDQGQEADDGGVVVFHYKPTATASSEGKDAGETDPDKSWAPLIPTFTEFTGATEAQAYEYLTLANGNAREAVRLFMGKSPSESQERPSNTTVEGQDEEQKPLTLLDEALLAARPKRLRRDGEVVVVLDVHDLSKTYRLRSEDVEAASPIFKASLTANAQVKAIDNHHSIKHLFILRDSILDGVPPLLAPKALDTLRADCEGEFHQTPTIATDEKLNNEPAEQIKVEDALGLEAAAPVKEPMHDAACTWIDAYETVIRIISFPTVNPGISKTDIDKALEKIELVAQIAKVVQAVPSVSRALDSIFNAYIQNQQLWSAIAKDAARWMLVGVNLEKLLVYNEAFTHVAGFFPHWPWSTPMAKMPFDLAPMIAAKSLTLELARKDVERKLLCLTLTGEVDTNTRTKPKPTYKAYVSHQVNILEFTVVSIFRDWIALHLAHTDSGDKGTPKTRTAICDHRDKECLTVAGLHRLISKGGDAYMPVETLLKDYWATNDFPLDTEDPGTIRSALKTLKTRAAKLVAPMLVSGLNFEGRDKLSYLTAIDVTDADVPWDTRKTFDAVGDEDDSDEL